MPPQRDSGMTLVELLIAMALSVLLVGVLVTALTLVLRVGIGESSAATQVGGQNADLIPAQLQANSGVQQMARTFSADVANVGDASQVSTTAAANPTCGRPGSDPALSLPDSLIVRFSLTDTANHSIDYRFSRDSRQTQGQVVRYECIGGAPSARVLAMGLSSKSADVPTVTSSGSTNIKTFTLTLTNIAKRVYRFDATMRADITATLPPGPTSSPAPLQTVATAVKMLDADMDGKVDAVAVTFGTTSVTGCLTGWRLGGTIPSGGTQGLLNTASGSTVTIPITEGPGAADTAVGSLTVSYIPSAVCSQLAPLTAVSPTDAAAPVVTGLVATTGGTAQGKGKMESGDTFGVTFSETLLASTVPTSITAMETGGKSSGQVVQDKIAIADASAGGKNLTNGALGLGTSETYLGQSKSASYSGSVANATVGGDTTLTVSLSGSCVNVVNNSCTSLASSSGAFTFTPSATLTDAAGNGATGSFTAPASPVWKMF